MKRLQKCYKLYWKVELNDWNLIPNRSTYEKMMMFSKVMNSWENVTWAILYVKVTVIFVQYINSINYNIKFISILSFENNLCVVPIMFKINHKIKINISNERGTVNEK